MCCFVMFLALWLPNCVYVTYDWLISSGAFHAFMTRRLYLDKLKIAVQSLCSLVSSLYELAAMPASFPMLRLTPLIRLWQRKWVTVSRVSTWIYLLSRLTGDGNSSVFVEVMLHSLLKGTLCTTCKDNEDYRRQTLTKVLTLFCFLGCH